MKKGLSAFLCVLLLVGLFSGATLASGESSTTLRLWYDEPASSTASVSDGNGVWQSATLPIGNGRLGANIYGETSTEHLTVNEETLWSGGRNSVSNYDGGNVSHSDSNWATWVSQVKSGSFNAETLAGDSASSSGYYNGYQPLGDLYFAFGHSSVSSYTRQLNLETGVSSVNYTCGGVAYTREYFASDDPNVLVARFTADQAGSIGFTASFSSKQSVSSSVATVSNSIGYITYVGAVSNNGLLYTAKVGLKANGGTVTASGNTLVVSGATDVTVYFTAATDYATTFSSGSTNWYYRTGESVTTLSANSATVLANALSAGYDTLRSNFDSYYTNLFGRVSVDLGQSSSKTTDALLSGYSSATTAEKRYLEVLQYQYGRYLLISGSSEKSQLPTTLQGIWNNNTSAPWYSDIHTNINLEMNYWLASAGNLNECLKPLAEYMEAMYAPGNYTVQAYTDADTGMMMHTQNTPFGYTSPGWSISTWGWSPSASTWLLQNCYDYFEYTQDKTYLENTIFPLLVKQCEMYRQLLENEGISSDPVYVFPIAYSPEHGSITYGNTYEQSIIWQLFEDTIEAAKALGYSSSDTVYSDKSLKLSDIEYIFAHLKGLDYSGGYIKEWYTESYYGQYGESSHRHISQLLGVYPGNMASSTAVKEAAVQTLEYRGANTVSGWSLAQRACTWAAVGDGDKAYTYLQYVLTNGVMKNLWGYHSYGGYGGDGKAFQIDANYGYSAAFNEMLLQSNYGFIDLLPAIPGTWSSGSFSGLLAEGNFSVSCTWANSAVTGLSITSNAGGSCSVEFDITGKGVFDSSGNTVSYTNANGIVTFNTTAGETYSLRYPTGGAVPTVTASPTAAATATPAPTATATPEPGLAPAPSAVVNSDHSITLTWEAKDGVTYTIYRRVKTGG